MAAPLDPAAFVISFENAGGDPTAKNPASSASGDFQMLTGTWVQYATAAGINTTQYPTAASAPVSAQYAAFGAMYNARGLADYVCPNCDAKLTAAYNNLGGQSAFAAKGSLSTDPATYASYDTPGTTPSTQFASQNAFSDPLGGSGAVYGTGNAQANPGYTVGPLGSPYTWMWTQLTVNTQTSINNAITNIEAMAGSVIGGVLFIAIAAAALRRALHG